MKTPAVLNRLPAKKPSAVTAPEPAESLRGKAPALVEAPVSAAADVSPDASADAAATQPSRAKGAAGAPTRTRRSSPKPRATVRQKTRALTQAQPKVHVTTIRVTPFTRDSLEGALATRKQRFDFSVRNKSEVVRLALEWFFETCRGDVGELEHFGDEDVRTESISVRLEDRLWNCYQQIPDGSRGALCNAIVATYVKRHLQKVKMTFDLRALG